MALIQMGNSFPRFGACWTNSRGRLNRIGSSHHPPLTTVSHTLHGFADVFSCGRCILSRPPLWVAIPITRVAGKLCRGMRRSLMTAHAQACKAPLSFTFSRSRLRSTRCSGQTQRGVPRNLIIIANFSSLAALARPKSPTHDTSTHGRAQTKVGGTP